MAREMLINVSEGEECRIALLENGLLQELYMERTSATSHVGNIYKGRVTNVEASIQAAFVDFGLGRNGFLHISDLMPSYFGRDGGDIQESVGRKLSRRDRPPIQRCLRRGDEIVVQIIKEGIGTKGPTLSTYISIPGRILVMMPGMGKFGVSRKIEDDEERRRLRMILDGLKPIKDVGFIIRTAGIGKTGAEIERDLTYLTRLWENIQRKMRDPAPVELYTEGDLVTRTVRDAYSSDLDRIVVDNLEVGKRIKDFFKIALPRNRSRIELYDSPVPLFHQANIEREIEMMNSRHVPLPSGGSLVIDSTEAVVAIDVNSGKFREHNDAEMTAFKTDMEAADEIPRQLKLRDLGGVIICDFIDLRYDRNRRELEERLHNNFKNDRAKTKVLRMSQFGIIELTRQRMRPSLKRSIYFDCPHCKGGGLVKTPESMSLDVMRRLAIAAYDPKVARIEMTVGSEVGVYVLNKKRAELTALEADSGRRIIVKQDATLGIDETKLKLLDPRDGFVYLEELGMDPNDAREDEARRVQPAARRDRRGGRGGRPLPQSRGQSRGHDDEEGDELDHAEDAIDQRDDDLDAPITPLAAPIKVRAIPKVPLGKVVGTLLTDEEEVFDEHESSVIEVDEPNEPLGDGPQEFEEDLPRGRGYDRGRNYGGDRNAPRGNDRNGGRGREQNRDARFDNRRDNRPNGPVDNRPPGRPETRPETRPGLPRPIDRFGDRSGRPTVGAGNRPNIPQSRDPHDEAGEHGDFDDQNDSPGNQVNNDVEHSGNDMGEGAPRRRRRRGRRGRGNGNFEGPRDQQPRPLGSNDERNIEETPENADAAFGTSDANPDSLAADSVGMAGEEIDADAIDSEFSTSADGSKSSEPGVEGLDGQPRKRRRRRGGRRHRRNRDGNLEDGIPQTPLAAGEPAADASNPEEHDRADLADLEVDNEIDDEIDDEEVIDSDEVDDDGDEDRIVAVTPFPPIAEDEFDDAREDMNDSRDAGDDSEPPQSGRPTTLRDQEIEAGITAEAGPSAENPGENLAEKPARTRGGRSGNARGRGATEPRPRSGRSATIRGRQIEAGIISEPDAAAEGVVETTEPAVDADADEPKSKRRRGGRSVTGRAAPATSRRAPRKPPIPDQPATSTPEVTPPAPVERTGSTDRHLVDDIPVDPEPPRRPRSYEDLDAVPDDFD